MVICLLLILSRSIAVPFSVFFARGARTETATAELGSVYLLVSVSLSKMSEPIIAEFGIGACIENCDANLVLALLTLHVPSFA
jgi:hypothetical protein